MSDFFVSLVECCVLLLLTLWLNFCAHNNSLTLFLLKLKPVDFSSPFFQGKKHTQKKRKPTNKLIHPSFSFFQIPPNSSRNDNNNNNLDDANCFAMANETTIDRICNELKKIAHPFQFSNVCFCSNSFKFVVVAKNNNKTQTKLNPTKHNQSTNQTTSINNQNSHRFSYSNRFLLVHKQQQQQNCHCAQNWKFINCNQIEISTKNSNFN